MYWVSQKSQGSMEFILIGSAAFEYVVAMEREQLLHEESFITQAGKFYT